MVVYKRPPVSEDQAKMLDFPEWKGKPKRILVVPAGTKTGKTVGGAIWITEGLLQGMRCAWVGPWHKRTRTGFDHIKGFLKEFEAAGYAKCNSSDMIIEVYQTTTGKKGTLTCFSGDNPDSVYGDAFDRVFVDECTRQPEGILGSVRSTLSATGGCGIFAFNTDRGVKHWAIRLFNLAKSGSEESYCYLTMPTSASPYVPASDIEQARRTLPDRVFRALYLAEIQDDGAGVFRDPRSCISSKPFRLEGSAVIVEEPAFGHTYVAGVDLARKYDYTVITVMDRNTREVVYFDRFHGLPWHQQRARIASICEQYNHCKAVIDATGVGDPNVEELTRDGVWVEGLVFNNASKRELVERLVVAIEQKEISYPDIPELLGELDVYEYQSTRTGMLTYNAPDGYHDDCTVSLMLAVRGLGAFYRFDAKTWNPAWGEALASDNWMAAL